MVSRVDMQSRTCTKSRPPPAPRLKGQRCAGGCQTQRGKRNAFLAAQQKAFQFLFAETSCKNGVQGSTFSWRSVLFFSLDNFCQWTGIGRVQRCQRLPVVFLLEQLSRATIDKIRTHELAPHAIRMPMIFTWRTHQLEWDTSMQISLQTHMICVFTCVYSYATLN